MTYHDEQHGSFWQPALGPRNRSLAGLLSPVRCSLRQLPEGWELQTCGLSIDRLLLVLSSISDEAHTLVGFSTGEGESPIGPPRIQESGHVVNNSILGRIAWVVQIDGPVEVEDAQAIQRAWECGDSLLNAEIRANASLEVDANDTLVLRARDEEVVLQAAGEVLRAHVATQRGQSATDIAPPEPGLVHGLLDASGSIALRAIETETYPTWVDVGISTCPNGTIKSADTSVIYDAVGNTWHGDF